MEDLFIQIYAKFNPAINCQVSELFTLEWKALETSTGTASHVVDPLSLAYSDENITDYEGISFYHGLASTC